MSEAEDSLERVTMYAKRVESDVKRLARSRQLRNDAIRQAAMYHSERVVAASGNVSRTQVQDMKKGRA